MEKTSYNKMLIKTLLMFVLLTSVFILCSCNFGGSAENSDKKQASIGEIKDIYYDGRFFCYDIGPHEDDIYIKYFITIDGVKTEIKEGYAYLENEVITSNYNIFDEVEKCISPSFTLSAYTLSKDRTTTSTEKSVTFRNACFNPILDVESGQLTWQTNEFIEYYDLSVTCPPYSVIDYSENNTSGEINLNDVFDEVKEDVIVVYIEPIEVENISPEALRTTYYAKNQVAKRYYRQTLDDVCFYDNAIYWDCFDATRIGEEVEISFDITIYDGDEVIEETITYNRDYNFRAYYPYTPKSDNFYFTIKGGANYPSMVVKDAIEIRPECVGKVSNLKLENSKISWDFEKIGDRELNSENLQYEVFQDGASLKTISNNYIYTGELNQTYGNTTISVLPQIGFTNCYCSMELEPLTTFYAKTPVVELEENDEKSVKIKLTNIDENASEYELICNKSNLSVKLKNVYEGFTYVFTPDLEKIDSHYVYANAIYEGKSNVIESESDSAEVEILKRTEFLSSHYQEGSWYLRFNDEIEPFNDLEYSIITSDSSQNSDGVCKSYEDMEFELPEIISSAFSTKEITVKSRFVPKNPDKTHIQLNAGYDEYIVKNLPCPTTSNISNGVLTWEMETDLPYKDYTVVIYKNLENNEEKIISTNYISGTSLDLAAKELEPGPYEVRIYANANKDEFKKGEIVLNGTKRYYLMFNQFDECMAYPTGQNKVLFMRNDSDKLYTNKINEILVKLYTDNNEETISVENNEEVDIRSYLDNWQVDTINADVTVIGKVNSISSKTKTITISAPKVSGFKLNNKNGTISWEDFVLNSTYNYSLKTKAETDEEFTELISATEYEGSELNISSTVLEYLQQTSNINKSFKDFSFSLITSVDTADLTSQKNSAELILAPLDEEFNFNGLTYGISKQAEKILEFTFNKEFETVPNITAKALDGTNLGTQPATGAQFYFNSLSEGSHTIEFTNNISNDVMDVNNILNIPHYHSMSIIGKSTPDGEFKNFSAGSYVCEKNSISGEYYVAPSKSTPATVDFKVTSGSRVFFNDEEVALTNGIYTLDLLTSKSITVSSTGTEGLVGTHYYNKYTYTNSKTFTFECERPPRPNYINVTDGELTVRVSYYSQFSRYDVSVNGEFISETRYFTKATNSATDTFKPLDAITDEILFTSGSELVIYISGGHGTETVEADFVIYYTVP